tara:strand:- start:3314 stop:4285 length:972 start_codon:yes stop_codon:yes gene_type:complete
MKKYFHLISTILFFFSCEKGEIPVNLDRSELKITQINLESNYAKQVFYNVKQNSIISSNIKTEWDLGFGNEEGVFNIIINSSVFSQIKKINNLLFEEVTTVPDSINWSWDDPSNTSNTAIGNSWGDNITYIIDLGFDIDGNSRGYKKFKVDTFSNNYYIITVSNLNNSELRTIQIPKNENLQYTRFSLDSSTIISSPNKDDWDLLFSQYTHLYADSIVPAYLVTGTLINQKSGIEVAIDSVNTFSDIIFSNINNYTFKNNQDIIGYNWKLYDFDNGYYIINSNISYIIKNTEGRYYKLRFIDFYNDVGVKGYPTFEVQEILPF